MTEGGDKLGKKMISTRSVLYYSTPRREGAFPRYFFSAVFLRGDDNA